MTWIGYAFLSAAVLAVTIRIVVYLRMLDAHPRSETPDVNTDRYLPMLRLLSDQSSGLAADPALCRKLRKQRCSLLREYLGDLTDDYGRLLGGVRFVMAQSGVDRPDLAKVLLRNRILFVGALCRIDLHLQLHAWGIGSTEVLRLDAMGLLDGLEVLRGQFSFLAESAVWGG